MSFVDGSYPALENMTKLLYTKTCNFSKQTAKLTGEAMDTGHKKLTQGYQASYQAVDKGVTQVRKFVMDNAPHVRNSAIATRDYAIDLAIDGARFARETSVSGKNYVVENAPYARDRAIATKNYVIENAPYARDKTIETASTTVRAGITGTAAIAAICGSVWAGAAVKSSIYG